jgi:hypothetical protein
MSMRSLNITLTIGLASMSLVGCEPLEDEPLEDEPDSALIESSPSAADVEGSEAELKDDAGDPIALAVGPCPNEYMCLYDTSSSSTWMSASPDSLTAFRCYGAIQNNKTSYAVNWTYARWRVYNSSNCTGTPGYFYPQTSGAMNSTWNNVISSFMREPIP